MWSVEFEHVVKRFPGAPRPAVDDVSLCVEAGQFAVLLGPSGSGKTTLLKMVNRLHEPDAGHIRVGGADVRSLEADQLRRQIGYVIQHALLAQETGIPRQNIAVVPRLLHWGKDRTAARVDELLELVGLQPADEYRDRYPAQLSGGEQQRVGVARALAADPGLLLMDEPFGAIDAITRANLQREMQELHRRLHVTVLFVTHDVDEALRLAEVIAVIGEGRLLQFATPLQLLIRPADGVVAGLVGAGDVVRRLRLLTVADALRVAAPADGAGVRAASSQAPRPLVVRPDQSLQEALVALLASGAHELVVDGEAGDHGRLSMHAIHVALTSREKTT